MKDITALYNKAKSIGLLRKIGFEEPLEHIITVDKIRKYWKPGNVRVVLLAESHIKTEQKVFEDEKDLTRFDGIDGNYPKNVIDFVYCLGQDAGKIQFWKILSASVGDFDFSKLMMKGISFDERTRHRIQIINEMKRRGIWLVDASLFALYPKDTPSNTVKVRKEIIMMCWKEYVKDIIFNESPEKILFIGKEVWNALEERIPSHIEKDWIYQPRAQIGDYQPYLDKCYKFCKN